MDVNILQNNYYIYIVLWEFEFTALGFQSQNKLSILSSCVT